QGQLWVKRLERGCRSGEPSGTHRTAVASYACVRGRLPFVGGVGRAAPPYLFTASNRHAVWREIAVLGGVPLGGQVGVQGPKRSRRRDHLPGTDRASVAFYPCCRRRLPYVSGFDLANPPDLFIGFGPHVVGRGAYVLGGVPLQSQSGVQRPERSCRRDGFP